MKSIDEIQLPEACRYTAEHVWVRRDGDELVAGISDFAQDQLGEIAFVDLPSPGTDVAAGEEFGTVESLKSVNALFMPVSGEITEVNEALESTPTLINVSPYEKGWIIRIRPADMGDADAMLDGDAYRAGLA